MNTQKLSINMAVIIITAVIVLLSGVLLTTLYLLTDNIIVVLYGVLYVILVFLCAAIFVGILRRKLVLFSDTLCELLDSMMAGEIDIPQAAEEENIFYKIYYRMTRLYEVMRETRHSVTKERKELQELISDISHQVKTPIANLKMIDTTLLEQPMSEEKRKDFLKAMGGQIDKLDFLMQAMIKTSRLETGVISLDKKTQPVYDTLAAALGGILLNAEKKDIQVAVSCSESWEVSHDRKWTSEALFNILDNAVKYTPAGGRVNVSVALWETYMKIDIADTGRGIPENCQGAIFKRFYREEDVHDTDGIGIGLYLAREIITMQGGYIKVSSKAGNGSTFSVFLPRE